ARLPDGPGAPPLRAAGLVGDQDHPALLDRRRRLRGDRLHRVPAEHPRLALVKPRPPLPPGPYLVVGLARSGVAAALALRARDEAVIGYDAGGDEEPALAQAAGRLREAGVEVRLDASGVDLAARARTLIKSPGV